MICGKWYLTDLMCISLITGLPWWLRGRESSCQCRRCGFNPWVWKIPWRRKWQHTPVFLPGKSHGQRNLAGYSQGCTNTQTWLSDYKQQQLKLEFTSEMSGLSLIQLRKMNLGTSPQYFLCVLTLTAFKEIQIKCQNKNYLPLFYLIILPLFLFLF